jgi:hypothetical protein
MKTLFCICTVLLFLSATAQPPGFAVREIKLPEEIAYSENQFSGLAVNGNRLFMMSESRLQQGFEAKLYALDLPAVEAHLSDSMVEIPWKKYPILHLDVLKNKIDAAGQNFEGLEAIIIENDIVYFSVETNTESASCFLIKGLLAGSAVILDTTFLVTVPKFRFLNDAAVFNAGFEAMVKQGDFFYSFYEYNYFAGQNLVQVFDRFSFAGNNCLHRFPISKIPFRITDITATGNNRFTAINYFYKGDDDSVYRVPATDSIAHRLIHDGSKYVSYCRLIDVELQDTGFTWKPLWELPQQYHTCNWEGIAAYKNGYFIVNDKFSAKPLRSVLLYLQKK